MRPHRTLGSAHKKKQGEGESGEKGGKGGRERKSEGREGREGREGNGKRKGNPPASLCARSTASRAWYESTLPSVRRTTRWAPPAWACGLAMAPASESASAMFVPPFMRVIFPVASESSDGRHARSGSSTRIWNTAHTHTHTCMHTHTPHHPIRYVRLRHGGQSLLSLFSLRGLPLSRDLWVGKTSSLPGLRPGEREGEREGERGGERGDGGLCLCLPRY